MKRFLCLMLLLLGVLSAGQEAFAQQRYYDAPPPPQERYYGPPPQQQRARPARPQQAPQPPPPQQGGFRIPFLDAIGESLGLIPRQPQTYVPGQAGAPGDPNQPPPPPRRRVEPTTFVAVLGDSFAESLSSALTEVFADRQEVAFVRKVRPGVGFLDPQGGWDAAAREIAAREKPVNAAVIFLGPDEGGSARPNVPDADGDLPRSPWVDEYAARIDDLLLTFRSKKVPVVWVGLPPVADPQRSADHALVNDLIRQRVTAFGGVFVDAWENFVDQDGKFTAQGPGIDGRVTRLRMADGVRFTRAGARKLAHYVDVELRALLAPKGPEAQAALTRELVPENAPRIPGASRVIILTNAPRSFGGALLPPDDPAVAKVSTPAQNAELGEAALQKGEAAPPKPGRADDYAWK